MTAGAASLTTTIHNASHNMVTSVVAGTTVHDSASITGLGGSFPSPAGTVDFTFFSNGTCAGSGTASGAGIALVNGMADPSASQTPLVAGSYSFKAHFNGDSNYLAADSACEPLTVTRPITSQIAPTETTCQQFTSGTASDLDTDACL